MRTQRVRSAYVGFFCLPVVPALAWLLGHRPVGRALAARDGLPRDHWGPELGSDAVHGLELYRANVPQRMHRPRRLRTGVPVLVLHPTRDRFLGAVLTEDLDRACSDLRVEHVDAPHWVIRTDPDRVAALVTGHVAGHLTGPAGTA